jgi:UDP-N-acetylglucosamine diphosphorylase/glucosamine-1-phosphate N-acetyltransferase
MNILLFDPPGVRESLLPFTYTRPVAALRCGILTIAEKWEKQAGASVSYLTSPHLQGKFPAIPTTKNWLIHGAACPTQELWSQIQGLTEHQVLMYGEIPVAGQSASGKWEELQGKNPVPYAGEITFIDKPWKIFKYNAAQIKADFALLTHGRKSQPITDSYTKIYGAENIFLEEGATIKAAVLNAETGPIYLGKNSQIHEGALIRGSFALCEGAQVSMGAKLRGDTTLGPYCKAGGEISNSVLFGYSNKSHDGFLGNSVLGEWCNIGADTNTSNMKNNYENVKIWDYELGRFADTGEMFCGLLMGDHSKCGINTMFNTGTVVGVGANIFGDGFPRSFIPSFAWGGATGFTTFQLDKALITAAKAMDRRGILLSEEDRVILQNVFELSAPQRVWEKK